MTPLPRQFNSEQIRWALGIFTPAELEAQARREAEEAQRLAKDAALGVPLFNLECS